jgi:hypothetical protein
MHTSEGHTGTTTHPEKTVTAALTCTFAEDRNIFAIRVARLTAPAYGCHYI